MTVVAVIAPNATEEPKTEQLTALAMKTTSRAAFTGTWFAPSTFLKKEEPGKMPSREMAKVTRCADRITAAVAQVQSIQFMTSIAVAPRVPMTWTRNSAQLFA